MNLFFSYLPLLFLLITSSALAREAPVDQPEANRPTTTTPLTDDPNRSPFEVDLGLDLGLTFGPLMVVGLPRLFVDHFMDATCPGDCNPDDMNPLDRYVTGRYSHRAKLISDIGAGASMALPFLLGAIDVLVSSPTDGWNGYGKDCLVLAQTLSLTMATNNVLNFIIRRPRPRVFNPSVPKEERIYGDSMLSFPSGHTAGSFAMATAYSRLFMMRHPNSPLIVPIWLGTYGLATATGVLRTEAGDHFWTDVIAGAMLGIGFGLLIPYLHERKSSETQSGWTAAFPTRLALLPFATTSGGFGAQVILR